MVSVCAILTLANSTTYTRYRVEKQASSTRNVKWDGAAFLVNNKKVIPLFVELSGRINFNSSPDKERSDEGKIIKQFFF
ncbi:hypothetical protein BCV72DRAFT_135282 [Rhizopus microsporus var. microsporus]|uniref:Uncharacterized protein n=2 Tax=Rhizopus microsporus TaxID=58291 RepID=A0A2G4SIE2_RHIZD|nr:uncharacterized protein RHIMIDRAFT_268857 [Rhizopus microsporus ATCC 52813]ORE05670.1 hypothetical protein BCV72DRAFT_135282 [Rhizopus microsporus var. microsporus]PHZ08543.1 hypothetical protein RHIMIDRAFT_268857 [Rhizopus microsporus ATCC 52813]